MTAAPSGRILGFALARGLVSGESLDGILADGVHDAKEILAILESRGDLDAEDLAILESLARTDDAAAPPSGPPSWISGEISGSGTPLNPGRDDLSDGSGRRVLQTQSLPAWKQYRDLHFIGEGGMGRIFKAFDPSLKRTVALKFLRRDDPALVMRFVLEAQHQARVDHPNIAKVFEVGEWNGQSFIAMQFIKGESLELLAPTLSWSEHARVMEVVAEAIHGAHRQGLIHRDLKPANILVERDGERLKPTVLDFGLARGAEASGLTLQGLVIGTTHYMAPEQARGEHEKVDRRTDVYGLGATLHKLLTGRPPFAGVEGLEGLRRAAEEELPPLRRLVPELPEELELITTKCLEKDPERRYQSALAVAEDLRRWREGEPIHAKRPTLRYRGEKWARKHRSLVWVAALALVGVLAMGGLALKERVQASRQARFAQHFAQEAERVEAMLRYIRLSPAHDIEPEMAQVEQRVQALEADMRRGGRLALGPGQFALGRADLALDHPEEAEDHFRDARKAGFQDADLDLFQARARVRLYQRDLSRVRQLSEPRAREEKRQALEKQFRKEVLPLLERRSGLGLEPSPYQQGLIALVEGRTEVARSLGRQVHQSSPWFYEAQMLVADAYLADALQKTSLREGLDDLAQAGQALERCLAPSDPGLLRRRARLLVQSLSWEADLGEAPFLGTKALRDLMRQWRALQPTAAEPLLFVTRAEILDLAWRRMHGGVPLELAQRGVSLARETLARNPDNPEAQGLLSRMLTLHSTSQTVLGAPAARPMLEEALTLGLSALEADPYQAGLVFGIGSTASYLCAVLRDLGLPVAEWVGLPSRLEALQQRHPELKEVNEALATILVDLAETQRVNGEDPTAMAERAIHAAQRDQALRPDNYQGYRQEGNAQLVLAWHQLYQGLDPRPRTRAASEAIAKAQQINPRSALDFVNAPIAYWIEAAFLLRSGKDPAPVLRQARSALRASKSRDSVYWYNDYLDAELMLVEAEWRLAQGEVIDAWLARVLPLLRQAWLNTEAVEAPLLKARFARLRLQAGREASPKLQREAEEALRILQKRFPKMPETQEAALRLREVRPGG